MRTRMLALAASSVLAVLAPASAPAQLGGKFVFTPYVGAYVPSGDLVRSSLTAGDVAAAGSARHRSSVAFGTTGSFWVTDRVGLEGGLVYSSSSLKSGGFLNEAGVVTPGSGRDYANVWLGSAKLMVQLLPPESDYNVRLGFGPALITRNGSAYASDAEGSYTGLTDLGAVLSMCTRLRLTDMFSLRLRGEDYIYQANVGFKDKLTGQTIPFGERQQNDFVFSLGLQMFLNPSGR
jgi:hypothetical protein